VSARVVVVGAGAAGLSAANRLAGARLPGVEVVVVDRSGEHVFWPGLVSVLFGDVDPAGIRKPVASLTAEGVRLVAGEVTQIRAAEHRVTGSFGELPYDYLIVALGAEVGWADAPPACGELAPWTVAGVAAGQQALRRLGPGSRVVVGPASLPYRCPPAVLDLAARVRQVTGAEVTVVHPWRVPLEPFGEQPASAVARLLHAAGVAFRGGFRIAKIEPDAVLDETGQAVPYDVAFVVPPHRPPRVVAASGLAAPSGWMRVDFPGLRHPAHPRVFGAGDLVAPVLGAGMAGTLGVFEGAHVADAVAAELSGDPAPPRPRMAAICFFDTGRTGSFLYCDFGPPAAGTGPAGCVFMPELPYFRQAKRLFAEEWFASMLTGEVG
jgi:sulfide:quinone oxidoreductase